MLSFFFDARNNTLTLPGLMVVVIIIALIIAALYYFFVTRQTLQTYDDDKKKFSEMFSELGFEPKTVAGREVFIAKYKKTPIVASWAIVTDQVSSQQKKIFLTAAVPGTQDISLRATSREEVPKVNGMVDIKDAHGFNSENVAFFTDAKKFPNGVTLTSGFLHFYYGDKAVNEWFPGDETLPKSIVVQVMMPFNTPKEDIKKQLDNLAEAKELVQYRLIRPR